MLRLTALCALSLLVMLASGCKKDETRPNTPPQSIQNLAVESVTASAIGITWTSPRDDARSCACSYDIRYSTSPITEDNWGDASIVTDEPAPATAGEQEHYLVRELGPLEPMPPGATGATTIWRYYVAIKACDGATGCWSGMSNVASATLPVR